MLKIYFAGSIRRGRADAAIYNQDSGLAEGPRSLEWLAPLQLTRERPHQYYST